MYLKKAKRYFDVQESRDTNDKRDRSKEHGSSSGVVCMGMMRSGASGNSSPSSAALTPAEVLTIANSDTADIEGNEDDEEEFRPEDLPDGACFRPRSVLVNSDTDQTAIRPAEVRIPLSNNYYTCVGSILPSSNLSSFRHIFVVFFN